MDIFIQEYLWNIFIFFGLSFAGGFGILAFSRDLRFSFFLAPLMGLFFIVFATATFYTILGKPLAICGILALILCFSLTASSFLISRSHLSFRPDPLLIIFALGLMALLTYLCNYSSIFLGEPGFLFMDGSDHLAYAHLSDWLNTHFVSEHPEKNSMLPYQSWPAYMFFEDHPRFGSLFTLALIAGLRGLPGMFAYDNACAIILTIGILGVSAVFSRSRTTFILLALALLSSHWFDLAKSGFFGKILAYPALLAAVGLYLIKSRPFSLFSLLILAIFTATATAMHHYLSAGLFLTVLGGSYLILIFIQHLFSTQKQLPSHFSDDISILAFLIMISIVTGGIISRAFNTIGRMPFNLGWPTLFSNMFDLKLLGLRTDSAGPYLLFFMLIICIPIFFFYFFQAKRNQDKVALSLLIGSAILFFSLLLTNAKWQASQLIGTFYPWFLCAAIRCIDDTKFKWKWSFSSPPTLTLLTLFGLVVFFHIPFTVTVYHRFASEKNIDKTRRFALSQFDQIENIVRKEKLTVDLPNTMLTLPVLVELGRRKMDLQWTPQSWQAILAYRHWPTPTLDPAPYWLTLNTVTKDNCRVKYTTIQYHLWECYH